MAESDNMRGRPPRLTVPLETDSREYAELVGPIWAFMDGVVNRLYIPGGQAVSVFAMLLKSMNETNESMRAILRDAEKSESQESVTTGRHYDAVLLTRPQIESAMTGMLILQDDKWKIQYERAAWKSRLRQAYLGHLQVGAIDGADEWWRFFKRSSLGGSNAARSDGGPL